MFELGKLKLKECWIVYGLRIDVFSECKHISDSPTVRERTVGRCVQEVEQCCV